jgi:hypothetical protein
MELLKSNLGDKQQKKECHKSECGVEQNVPDTPAVQGEQQRNGRTGREEQE